MKLYGVQRWTKRYAHRTLLIIICKYSTKKMITCKIAEK